MKQITRKQKIRALKLENEALKKAINYANHMADNARNDAFNSFIENSGLLESIIKDMNDNLSNRLSYELAKHLCDNFSGISPSDANRLYYKVSEFLTNKEALAFIEHIKKSIKSEKFNMRFSVRSDETMANYKNIRIDIPSIHINYVTRYF